MGNCSRRSSNGTDLSSEQIPEQPRQAVQATEQSLPEAAPVETGQEAADGDCGFKLVPLTREIPAVQPAVQVPRPGCTVQVQRLPYELSGQALITVLQHSRALDRILGTSSGFQRQACTQAPWRGRVSSANDAQSSQNLLSTSTRA